MSDQIPTAQSLHLLRRQRHSFLNHLQVISGWLQLNRPERAQQYLEGVAARMTGESAVLRLSSAPLGLVILELGLEAETHGVHLDWSVSAADADLTEDQIDALRGQVLAALPAAVGGSVIIRLTASAFSVHTPSGKSEG